MTGTGCPRYVSENILTSEFSALTRLRMLLGFLPAACSQFASLTAIALLPAIARGEFKPPLVHTHQIRPHSRKRLSPWREDPSDNRPSINGCTDSKVEPVPAFAAPGLNRELGRSGQRDGWDLGSSLCSPMQVRLVDAKHWTIANNYSGNFTE